MSLLEMRRINLSLLKDGTPLAPAAGAAYTVFRQGATVSSAAVIGSSTNRVYVYNTGRVNASDVVQWSQDLSQIFTVAAVDPAGKWLDLYAPPGISHLLAVGDRLVPLYNPPALYSDSVGTTSLPSSTITLDAAGRASFYCRDTLHDAVLSGAGPTRLILDNRGGWSRGEPTWVNAKDHGSVQAAIDALPSTGGTVFIPAGNWVQTACIVLPTDRPVHLLGEGKLITTLSWASNPTTTTNDALIRVRGDGTIIEDLTILGPSTTPTASAPGRGISIGRKATESTAQPFRYFQLRDCVVTGTPSYAVYAYGADPRVDPGVDDNSISILCGISNCTLSYNVADGLVRINEACTTWTIAQCNIGASKGHQLYLDRCSLVSCDRCAFDTALDNSEYVFINSAVNITFNTCDFENPNSTPTSAYFVRLTGPLTAIVLLVGCSFFRSNPSVHLPTPVPMPNMASNLISCVNPDVVRGLIVIGVNLYMNVGGGPGNNATAASDILVENAQSEAYVTGSARGDDNHSSTLRVQLGNRRSVLLGRDRIRFPQMTSGDSTDPADISNMADLVEGDVIFNFTAKKLQVFIGDHFHDITVGP